MSHCHLNMEQYFSISKISFILNIETQYESESIHKFNIENLIAS